MMMPLTWVTNSWQCQKYKEGTVLFLLLISDIARNLSPKSRASSYVDDTRVTRSIVDKEDCKALQKDLVTIFEWAEQVNMIFNSDKFECLRYWPKENTKPDFTYKSPDGTEIEEKEHLRDLGVQIASDLTFSVCTYSEHCHCCQ